MGLALAMRTDNYKNSLNVCTLADTFRISKVERLQNFPYHILPLFPVLAYESCPICFSLVSENLYLCDV